MTFLVADRVQETTNSPGTGTATLLGAISGYQSFSTGIGANNTTYYVIADQLGINWEVGLGALNSTGTQLTRTTVYSSSNGGSTVNFATGTQYVWCDYPSSKAVIQGSAVNFSSIGATTAGTGAFTNLSYTGTLTGGTGAFTNLSYTGTLTGGTGIVNLGSGQFYIDGSGNVGIGTSSPSTYGKFAVAATTDKDGINILFPVSPSGTNGPALNFWNNGNTALYKGASIQGICTNGGSGGSSALIFNVTNAGTISEAMRIDSSGNLLVGGTGNASAGIIGVTYNGASKNGVALYNTDTGSANQYSLAFNRNGSLVGSITNTNTATVYNTLSDYRLKDVIGAISDSGQRLDTLEPIEYDFKVGGRTRGFLAHKFAEVYPNSVSGEKDAVDEEGKPIYQSMQASTPEVMADLIAEIQSLRKRVATLEAK